MARLMGLLRAANVEVRERRFSSEGGISGLDEPFVSFGHVILFPQIMVPTFLHRMMITAST